MDSSLLVPYDTRRQLSLVSRPSSPLSLVSRLLCVLSVGSYSLAVFANVACCHCCCCCRCCWCWRCCCCQQLLAASDTWHLMCIIAQLTIPCHFRGADSARDEVEAVAGEVRFLLWNFEVKVLHDHKRNQITNRAQMPLQVLRGEGLVLSGRCQVVPMCQTFLWAAAKAYSGCFFIRCSFVFSAILLCVNSPECACVCGCVLIYWRRCWRFYRCSWQYEKHLHWASQQWIDLGAGEPVDMFSRVSTQVKDPWV